MVRLVVTTVADKRATQQMYLIRMQMQMLMQANCVYYEHATPGNNLHESMRLMDMF